MRKMQNIAEVENSGIDKMALLIKVVIADKGSDLSIRKVELYKKLI